MNEAAAEVTRRGGPYAMPVGDTPAYAHATAGGATAVRFIGFTHPLFVQAAGREVAVSDVDAAEIMRRTHGQRSARHAGAAEAASPRPQWQHEPRRCLSFAGGNGLQ